MICFCLFLNNTSKNWLSFCPFSLFSKKSGLFFARSGLMIFTRALGTPSARIRTGRTSRWSDIAVVGHRGGRTSCGGRTSRSAVIQVVTHRDGHTTRTINLTTIRNQWLYTITVFPGKMIYPVKAPRPVAPRWRKKIAEEASVENGQHILLGQKIYSGASSSSAKFFSLAEVLRQGMKMFQENYLNFFFSKSWK